MATVRRISIQERRRLLVAHHCLDGSADGPEAVVQALVALHATDPASVYLSVLARSRRSTLADVAAAMYDWHALVRWLAMRRTLFVFARGDIPIIQAAVADELAVTLRRRLVTQLRRNGTDPPLPDPPEEWLAGLEGRVEQAIRRRGAATGAQVAADEPGLRTRILPRTASERPHNVTTPVLTIMGAAGRILRGTPTGSWTTRAHHWEPLDRRFPDGLEVLDRHAAQRDLARRWLMRFGPAQIEDLQWWTGWNLTTTRRAIAQLPLETVDLHGRSGIALRPIDGSEPAGPPPGEPVAALLPALDPTPMGWKHREWFLGIDPADIYDRAGNIGPTVWWDGEVVGGWAIGPDGHPRWTVTADRGHSALEAIGEAAAALHARLEGAIVTPAARTPTERSLVASSAGLRRD